MRVTQAIDDKCKFFSLMNLIAPMFCVLCECHFHGNTDCGQF